MPRLIPYFTFYSTKIECVLFLFSTSTTRFHEIRLHNFCLVLLTDTHKELPLVIVHVQYAVIQHIIQSSQTTHVSNHTEGVQ